MQYIDTQDLKNFSIKALDGEIGSVSDFYLDEEQLNLRYLVVDTEPFLLRNLVLISPHSFSKIDVENNTVNINLTKKEIEDSPPLYSAQKITQQYENDYNNYYFWPDYWGQGASAWSVGPYGVPRGSYELGAINSKSLFKKNKLLTETKAKDSELRSANEICSYYIKGINDKFGHIQGFILNTKTLSIDFIIVDTINFLPSKCVLLRSDWIEEISSDNKTITFPFFKDLITSAPAYKHSKITKEIIAKTDKHFKLAVNEKIKLNSSKKEMEVNDIPGGHFIVTAENPDSHEPEGFLASWVQQASINPPMINICIKNGRPGIDSVLKMAPFCINVIGKEKTRYFNHLVKRKSKNFDPLTTLSFQKIKGRGAIITEATSAIICKTQEISRTGDRYLVTAEVTEGVFLNDNFEQESYMR